MKFYSEMLNKFFDTEAECTEAEHEVVETYQKLEEKNARMAELKQLRASIVEYREKLEAAVDEFYDKQKSFFDDYNTLFSMEDEDEDEECHAECSCNCSDCDHCDKDEDDDEDDEDDTVTKTICMKSPEFSYDTFPSLWNLFYGGL